MGVIITEEEVIKCNKSIYPYIIPRLELAMLVDVGVDVAVGAVSALDVRPEALDVEVHLPAL